MAGMKSHTHSLATYVFIFILFTTVTATTFNVITGCPSQCTCSYTHDNREAVLCSTTDISSPPHNLNPKTQLLTIVGPRISPFSLSHISRKDFQSVSGLEHLTISFTHLSSIEEDSFLDLIHLKRIDLANNKIGELLPNTFITLRNLTVISLSNNPGLVVDDRAFWNLQSLRELYLSGIGLTELRPAMFYGLSNLRQLDVSSNQLTSFSPDTMLQMPNLWSLDLAFNDLMSLDSLLEQFFVHLKRVQLGGNRWQCNCLMRWLKKYPQFIAARSSDPVICSAPAGLEYVALSQIDVQQLLCEPPDIQKCPSSVSVLEGETLTIRCLVTGDPYPSITWTFADGTRMMSGSYPGMPIADRAAIQIPQISTSHEGNLTLTAANGIGTETFTIDVIVTMPTTPTTTSTTTPTTTRTTSSTTSPTSTTQSPTTTTMLTTDPTTISSTTETTQRQSTTDIIHTTFSTSTIPTSLKSSSTTPSTTTTTTTSTPITTVKQNRKAPSTKPTTKNSNNNNGIPKKSSQSESESKVDIAPIIIASVASTVSFMLGGGILFYFLKKWSKPRHAFKSKVAPQTPESGTELEQYPSTSSKKKDLTDKVLRMTKFDAPTRPHTLY